MTVYRITPKSNGCLILDIIKFNTVLFYEWDHCYALLAAYVRTSK